jgi:large subunit ribosomal protein L3
LVEGAVPGVAGGWIQIRDAVKRKLPADVPLPGKFRENGASAESAQTAPEAAAAEETA